MGAHRHGHGGTCFLEAGKLIGSRLVLDSLSEKNLSTISVDEVLSN